MRIAVAAVGRMKSGPERELADRYFARFARTCPAAGLGFGGIDETAESRARGAGERRREEARRVLSRLPDGALLIALDEEGDLVTSQAFAALLGSRRDEGRRDAVLAIGGADGHGEELLARADRKLSFGRLTYPHQIVRVLVAEQLYRATTILTGHPYHRD